MKKGFLIFIISLSVLAHVDESNIKPVLTFDQNNKSQLKIETGFIKVVPGKVTGWKRKPKEFEKVQEAFKVVEVVVNSEEFKVKVINYINSDGKREYTANNNLTNEQIYLRLMEGRELINGESTLGEINFDLKRYYRFWSKVIGRTFPGRHNRIEVNGKFYKKFVVSQMASNLMHEWIHLNGFYHASAKDHDSVPYAVGYIMESLAEKYLQQGYLD